LLRCARNDKKGRFPKMVDSGPYFITDIAPSDVPSIHFLIDEDQDRFNEIPELGQFN
jgi:hypothetical protein